jgi:hypothetical protein
LETFPAASTRSMKKGIPRAPERPQRRHPMGDLLDAGAEPGTEPVDIEAVPLGGARNSA